MANHPPHYGPTANTTLGNVNLSGTISHSNLWTSNAYSASPTPAYMRVGSGSSSMEMNIPADEQHGGKCFHLAPMPTGALQLVHQVIWEIFVTPPSSGLENIARSTESFANLPLWETPCGFFLSALFSVDTGATRWMTLPLSTVVVGGMRPEVQYAQAPVTLPKPLHVPTGSQLGFRIDMKNGFCCPVPLTLRCTMNFELGNQIEFR